MIIDSHQHFWIYEKEKHAWIDDAMSAIRRDFLPEDLKAVYQEHQIDGCVAVQADQTIAETDFLLNISSENDFVKGVVGWIDLRAADIDEQLDRYSDREKLKGWRHVVQGEADPKFLLRPEFTRGIAQLEKYGHTYDILVFPHQLGAVFEFVEKFPNQKFVIDHIAKPYIKDGFFSGWATMMKAVAKHENVHCKVSGMVTEADYQNWTPDQLEPYIDVVLNAFGTDRVMYGSDWPVCLVAANYGQVLNVVQSHIASFSDDEKEAIMAKNAMDFYALT